MLQTDRFEDVLQLGNFDEAGVVFVELVKDTFPRHQFRPQTLQLVHLQDTRPVVLATVVKEKNATEKKLYFRHIWVK